MVQEYPELARRVAGGNCVHCHNVAEQKAKERAKRPGFEPERDLWIYPDPARLEVGVYSMPIDQGAQ